jgi:hypothetical protein
MSNQHAGDLTAAIMAAAKSPTGMRTDNIPGFTTLQVGRMAQKLVARGVLFVAKISHRNARYFDNEATAKALTSKTAGAGVMVRDRIVKHSAWASLPPPDLSGLPVTECPSPPQHRYETNVVEYPSFSALKPGQYIAPASRWVEAVA